MIMYQKINKWCIENREKIQSAGLWFSVLFCLPMAGLFSVLLDMSVIPEYLSYALSLTFIFIIPLLVNIVSTRICIQKEN